MEDMEKLDFYDVNSRYLKYLQIFDDKIPNTGYLANEKFFCGVVLKINGFNYYAPISSFKQLQKTNFLIYDKTKPISSIRFCFMCPVPKSELIRKDIKGMTDIHYKTLVNKELKFCNLYREQIVKKASQVYKIGTNPNHFYFKTCCNFKILELQCKAYKPKS